MGVEIFAQKVNYANHINSWDPIVEHGINMQMLSHLLNKMLYQIVLLNKVTIHLISSIWG